MSLLQEIMSSLQDIAGAVQHFIAATPALQAVADMLLVIIPAALLLAFAGMGFVAATARILAVIRQRSAYEKCARQLALCGMGLGWLLLVASRIWLYFQPERFPAGSLPSYLVEMSWLLLSLAVLLSSIFFVLWRMLKNMAVLHMTIGIFSGVMGCVALGVTIISLRFLAAFAHPDTATIGMDRIFPLQWEAPFWTSVIYTLPLVFTMSAALGAFWLVLRRNRDDFGRDYYNTMIPWCATWARNGWMLLWLLLLASAGIQIWHTWQGGGFSQQEAILESSRILLWLIPALLWTMVCRSAIALRHKFTLLAALCLAAAFTLPWYLEMTRF